MKCNFYMQNNTNTCFTNIWGKTYGAVTLRYLTTPFSVWFMVVSITDERELLVCLPFLLQDLVAVLLVSAPLVAFLLDFISDLSVLFFSGRSAFFVGLFSGSCFGVLSCLFDTDRSVFSGLWDFSDKEISFFTGFSGVTSLLSFVSEPFSAIHNAVLVTKLWKSQVSNT